MTVAHNYREYLNEEFEKAQSEFEKAKQDAAAEIMRMSHFSATDFGAAYASHIDKVTASAAKLRTIAECLNTFDYFQGKAE